MRKVNFKLTRHGAALGAAVALMVPGVALASSATSQPAAGGTVTPFGPVRVMDTRHSAAVTGMQTLRVPVAGVDGVPRDVTGVVVNLTVTAETSTGYVTAYADGGTRPGTSTLNYQRGVTVANAALVPVVNGAVDLFNYEGAGQTTQLVLDVTGYTEAAQAAPAPVKADLPAVASVPTGGSFVTNSTEVGTLDLKAGTYQLVVQSKVAPLMTSDVQVFPQLFVYTQERNADFDGDAFNVSAGALESGGNTNIDSYLNGSGVVTLAQDATIHVYAFGYDSDRGAGSFNFEGGTVTAVPLS